MMVAGVVAVASKTVENLLAVKGVRMRERMGIGAVLEGGGAVIILKTTLL